MLPHRWNVRSAFINPATLEATQVALSMREEPCRYTHTLTRRLPELIRTAQPRIVEEEEQYRFQFVMWVWCNERFTMDNRESYVRNSTFDLSFEVVLFQRVEVHSALGMLDATLVWGYIEKLSVLVPLDRSSPSVSFDLITVAVERDYAIDPTAFSVRGPAGHIQSVTAPALMGTVDGEPNKQRWHLTVTISQYAICSTTASDGFTLDYVICSTRPQSAAHASSLVATLEGLENWCMLNTTVRLNSAQSTYTDPAAPTETVRFFTDNVVHVRDHVFTDITLNRTALLRVVLSGMALRSGTDLILFDAASPAASDPLLGFGLEQCPPSADAAWVCYSFRLAASHFRVNSDLKIVSTLRADINQHPARRSDSVVTTNTARVSSTLALGPAGEETRGTSSAPTAGLVAAVVVAAWALI
eukprot:m51a1_g2056 hypothetical protein (415) ;mRNA; r:1408852-1410096